MSPTGTCKEEGEGQEGGGKFRLVAACLEREKRNREGEEEEGGGEKEERRRRENRKGRERGKGETG